jgi:uncharacterized protein YcbK (DUF882 family)
MDMIAKYFSAKEFRCPESGILFVDSELLEQLDALREKLGQPLYVTSGCRSPEHNAKIGGSSKSMHITTTMTPCRAADVRARSAKQKYMIVKYALELGFGGIGVYATHVHLDIRDNEAMWVG